MANNNHQVLQHLRDAEYYIQRAGSTDQALESLIKALKSVSQGLEAAEREIQAQKRRLDDPRLDLISRLEPGLLDARRNGEG